MVCIQSYYFEFLSHTKIERLGSMNACSESRCLVQVSEKISLCNPCDPRIKFLRAGVVMSLVGIKKNIYHFGLFGQYLIFTS